MKIGIDLDEVIINTMQQYLEFLYFKFGKRINFQDIRHYNHWENKAIGGTKEEAIKNFDDFYNSKFFDEIRLIGGVFEAVETLRDGNELFIITSRPFRFMKKTKRFLQEYFPDIFTVFYSDDFHKQHSIGKASICERERIDVFVEDSLDYAIACSEKGVKSFLLDKPWNQSNGLHERVIRVNNWNEILENLVED